MLRRKLNRLNDTLEVDSEDLRVGAHSASIALAHGEGVRLNGGVSPHRVSHGTSVVNLHEVGASCSSASEEFVRLVLPAERHNGTFPRE